MHWILKQVEREKQITDEQVKIYEDLSKQINQDIDYAISAGFIVKMNGNAALHDRVIELRGDGEDSPRSFHLKLDKKRHTIVTDGSVTIGFALGICKHGGVCLNDSTGKEIQIHEASKAILYPFLFPYLTAESAAERNAEIFSKLAQ